MYLLCLFVSPSQVQGGAAQLAVPFRVSIECLCNVDQCLPSLLYADMGGGYGGGGYGGGGYGGGYSGGY